VGEVPAGYLFVDGVVGDVSNGVLRDRRVLSEEGVVVVVVAVDRHTGEIVTGPEVITRGWVFAPEAEELLEEAREAVRTAIAEAARGDGRSGGGADVEALRRRVRGAVGRLVSERTRRRPMIVPVVMEA
jgi:ribonuclease J